MANRGQHHGCGLQLRQDVAAESVAEQSGSLHGGQEAAHRGGAPAASGSPSALLLQLGHSQQPLSCEQQQHNPPARSAPPYPKSPSSHKLIILVSQLRAASSCMAKPTHYRRLDANFLPVPWRTCSSLTILRDSSCYLNTKLKALGV